MYSVNILVLTRYGELGASSRMRFYQYLSFLSNKNFNFVIQPLFNNAALLKLYSDGAYGFKVLIKSFSNRIIALSKVKEFDLIWIEKEALPWLPSFIELRMLQGIPFILDYDDAVFHNYDNHRFSLVRYTLGMRIDDLMASSALVVCGNEYLANRAVKAGAKFVEVLPTVIDLTRYPFDSSRKYLLNTTMRIVWIGSPSTAKYLDLLREPLQKLSQRLNFVLRVIGAHVDIPGVNVENVMWAESTEVARIAEGDIGVMPLVDSAWEKGKCGYKLIQYMACGLPVVASPVGINSQIVKPGINGFLAVTAEDWVFHLERLLTNSELCNRLGREGRKSVESKYCLQVTGPRMSDLLKQSLLRSI